jgi:hypothetical protein
MAIVRVIQATARGRDEIAFDEHAVERMRERGVTEGQVIATLQHPDITGLPTGPGRLRLRRHYGSHHSVDVVFEEEPDRLVVITVMRVIRS